MYSVEYGKLECTMAITKAGADLNVQDSKGKTAGNFFLSCMLKKAFLLSLHECRI